MPRRLPQFRRTLAPAVLILTGILLFRGCIPISATRQFQPDGTPRPQRANGPSANHPVRLRRTAIQESLTRFRETSFVRRESFRGTTSFKPLSERFTIARANLGAKMADRPYLFYELTNSLCGKCLRKVEAKVVIEDDHVYLHKWCPEHR